MMIAGFDNLDKCSQGCLDRLSKWFADNAVVSIGRWNGTVVLDIHSC